MGMTKTFQPIRKQRKTSDDELVLEDYITHDTVISRTVNAPVDIGIVNVVDFLNDNGVVTLHCCEGTSDSDPYSANRGYVHFADASHLEHALILLAKVAEEYDEWELADRILNNQRDYPVKKGHTADWRQRWKYEVAWSSAHVEGVEGFRGWRFTAVVRFSHEDAALLNALLAERMNESEDAWYAGYVIKYETGGLVQRS
jgi:hypothetical protein